MVDKLKLEKWNPATSQSEPLAEVSPWDISRAIKTPEQLVEILSDYLNRGTKDYNTGIAAGKVAQNQHPTLQGSMIRFCLGVVVGMSTNDYTDARNATPVALGRKLAQMLKDGTLDMGYMI